MNGRSPVLVLALTPLLAFGGMWSGDVWTDNLSDAASWTDIRVYPKRSSVNFDFGVAHADAASAVEISGAVTGKLDSAWHLRSERVNLPRSCSRMAFSFRICGTKKSPKPQTGGDWRTCIFWYDKSGEELTRAGVPVTVLANGFGRIRVTDAVPSGAASFAIQFGWDAPNVAEGRRYWIADVKLELLSDEATCGIEMPDVKAPLVVRRSVSPVVDAKAPFCFSVMDDSGIDWDSLKVSLDKRDVTARCVRTGNEVSLAPETPWRDGCNWIGIAVADNEGNVSESKKLLYVGSSPAASSKISLREDGMMLIDGKPFFSIGIYGFKRREMNGMSCERGIADLAAAGFNTVQSYGIGKDPEYLEAVARHGMRIWMGPPNPETKESVKYLANPSVVTWYIGDDTSQHLTPQELADRDDNARAVDPIRPTAQADAMKSDADVDNYENYAALTDGFLPEIYPVYSAETNKDRFCVATTIRDMKRFFLDNGRRGANRVHFAWPTIQYFKGWGWGRFPSRDELFGMSFAAIIHGAHGINWYTYGGSDGPVVPGKKYHYGVCWSAETWGNMTNLSSRIAMLRPALEMRKGPQPRAPEVVAGPKKASMGLPAVTQLLKSADGWSYLLTVNAADAEVSARLFPGAKGPVEVLWENRTVRCGADGSFVDAYAPLAVHVYKFKEVK